MTNPVGRQTSNYRLLQAVGEDEFTEVYLGGHLYLGSLTAIKPLYTSIAQGDVWRGTSRKDNRTEFTRRAPMRRVGITEMARQLEINRRNNPSPVLFLGARAGGLFRCQVFYEKLRQFSSSDFSRYSRTTQFGEYYRVLNSSRLSRADVYDILQISLQGLSNTVADDFLAGLIAQGFFDTIVSTNIDNVLEQALMKAGMREFRDYVVSVPPDVSVLKNIYAQTTHLIKVFGDFALMSYAIERQGYLDKNKDLRDDLKRILARDVLVVGLDPVWDADIIPSFPKQGGALWHVNEASPYDNVFWALQDREVTEHLGEDGSYENFWKVLRGS